VVVGEEVGAVVTGAIVVAGAEVGAGVVVGAAVVGAAVVIVGQQFPLSKTQE
jgi:ADP-glucose pyrophosphorylase